MRLGPARFISFILLAIIAATLWFVSRGERIPISASPSSKPAASESNPPATEVSRRSAVVAPQPRIVADRPAVGSLPPPSEGDARSHLADELNASNRTGMQDVSVVMNLFTQYRKRFHGYPVGEDNATFVNALSGNNPGRLAFIGRDHPAIDAQGQLLDRWGVPYFFHLLGHDALEIRSAGPDKELYTPDDIVAASPLARNSDAITDRR
jgi:hypothetical protein